MDFPQLIERLGIPETYSNSKIDASILKTSHQRTLCLFSQEKSFENLQYEKLKAIE